MLVGHIYKYVFGKSCIHPVRSVSLHTQTRNKMYNKLTTSHRVVYADGEGRLFFRSMCTVCHSPYDSVSNRNEYQEYFLVVKAAGS